jgi:regulator of cell morphogenesis and NO signaling
MMIKNFKASEKIGDIVARFPKAAEVFKIYNIDFCCGGDRPLSQAIVEQKLNQKEILERLEEQYETLRSMELEDVDFRKRSMTELIDHILNTHHVFVKTELPRISDLITKILRVHSVEHGQTLSQVHKLFGSLRMEMEQHLIKEEEILFPKIKEYEQNPSDQLLAEIISVMEETENEHDGAGDLIKSLRTVTNDFNAPGNSCASFVLTYKRLEEFESDLFQHIHLENNILFPKIKA